MAKPFIDISLIGDKAIQAALNELPQKAQKRAVSPALRKSVKRIKVIVEQKLSGIPIQPRTGQLLMGMIATAIKRLPARKHVIGHAIPLPERADVGLADDADRYYPAYLEYGYDLILHGKLVRHIPPKSFTRATVDERRQREIPAIASDMGKGIEKQWRLLAKKGVRR